MQNLLLSQLSEGDRDLLGPHLRPVTLQAQTLLCETGRCPAYAVFPNTAAVVRAVVLQNGNRVMTQVIGLEGVFGAASVLDDLPEQANAIVQCEGSADLIEAPALRLLCRECFSINSALLRYRHFAAAQADWIAACNASHTLEARVATCMLRLRDASGQPVLHLTQERLAEWLGANRTSVTLVADKMQQLEVISVRRGKIEVLDFRRLRRSACECYAAVNAIYTEFFPAIQRQVAIDAALQAG